MMFFLGMGCLFFIGVFINLFEKNYQEMAACMVLSLAMFAIYFSRRRHLAETVNDLLSSQRPQCCSKCGGVQNVRMMAYLLCYSLIFFTSKSPGNFRPVCDSCRVTAGLAYSLGTIFLGWWSFPWGPVYTIQCLVKNFQGGVLPEDLEEN